MAERATTKSPEPGDDRLVGVIDIGSSAIRLVIAEIQGPGRWRILDTADRPVSLGRDVFSTGAISRDSVVQSRQILDGFRELMDGYQVSRVRAIGTSALREAENSETFLDRMSLRTGIQIEIVEGIEANHYTYMAVRHALEDLTPRLSRTNSIIMEVGGGSTDLMLLQRGKMVAAHTLHIGTVRMLFHVDRGVSFGKSLERFQRENIRSTREVLRSELPLHRIGNFIAVGGDARLVAGRVGVEVSDHCSVIDRAAFREFVNKLETMSVDEMANFLHVPYGDAEALLPALIVYWSFLEDTRAKRLVVPDVSIRDGILLGLSRGASDGMHEELYRQVIASARSVGKKYHIDQGHAEQVTDLSLKLFDRLQDEHGLADRHRMLLEIAGLLHDVGAFVNTSSHHKHGQYIVANSDIFGLRREDVDTVGQVIRYHRKSVPKPAHLEFAAMSTQDRIVVLKLAAFLRIADAMDRGHINRIQDFRLVKGEDELVIEATGHGDIMLEQLSVAGKSDLFEDVFGLKVVLTQTPLTHQ